MKIKKNNTKKSVRFEQTTEAKLKNKLAKLNNDKNNFGRVDRDLMVSFLIDNMTKEQEELIKLSTLTWDIEEKRLIKIWSKKNGQLTDKEWKKMLYTGQLTSFVNEHSRLTV